MESRYSVTSVSSESIKPELPTLQPGVSVSLLQRAWAATPAEHRLQLANIFESRIVICNRTRTMKTLTVAEIEQAIGAATPRFFVRFYQHGLAGVQVRTFVVRSDAEEFAAGKALYGRPAVVQDLTGAVAR